tara:strand:+ start:1882 stop:3159 length:1278 start_codon:yes stop_codon:yes gene_type:complete
MKNILIVSYYWPPSGGSGVQRWLKFSKYLPKYNWRPIIFTPENPHFKVEDKYLLKDVSSEIEVIKNPIWEPYSIKDIFFGNSSKSESAGVISNKDSIKNRIFNWIRGNIFIPDPKIFWINSSVKKISNIIEEKDIRHIVTTGPPHSMHLIGLKLKKKFPELNWIADFRDPWSELDILDNFHLSYLARRKNIRLEREVLKNADVVLTVSESWMADLKRLGANRVEMITNGYDIDDIKAVNNKNDKFIVGHYGLINHLRNPTQLWAELNKLCEESMDFSNKLEIHLSGNVDKEVLNDIKSNLLLRDKIKMLGYLNHNQVIQAYNNTSLLLVLLFNSTSGIGNYPAKLFECLAVNRPIFTFGPAGSDTQKLFEKYHLDHYFVYDNILNLKQVVLDIFEKKNVMKKNDITVFSREKLTSDLADLLKSLN